MKERGEGSETQPLCGPRTEPPTGHHAGPGPFTAGERRVLRPGEKSSRVGAPSPDNSGNRICRLPAPHPDFFRAGDPGYPLALRNSSGARGQTPPWISPASGKTCGAETVPLRALASGSGGCMGRRPFLACDPVRGGHRP